MTNEPNWLSEETKKADLNLREGVKGNIEAPQLVRLKKAPTRKQKAFYIQDSYAEAFELLVFLQKKEKGKKAPDLAEEALLALFEKYKLDVNNL
ncbi:MAG: hypothetical protein OFPII_43510 [Osedax symbiont Rs1]|nr:MAG: hypothetical protein OFPII_43510 [Osedax symbiont Rs1]